MYKIWQWNDIVQQDPKHWARSLMGRSNIFRSILKPSQDWDRGLLSSYSTREVTEMLEYVRNKQWALIFTIAMKVSRWYMTL